MSKVSSVKVHIPLVIKMLEVVSKTVPIGGDIRTPVSKILDIQERINKMLFTTGYFSACCFHPEEIEIAVTNPVAFIEGVGNWLELVAGIADMMELQNNYIDGDFYALMTYVGVSGQENLVEDMKNNLSIQPKEDMDFAIGFYNGHKHLWGSLDPENDVYDVLVERAEVLKGKEEDFIWLYERLGDYRSKNVLLRTISHWINFNHDVLNNMKEMTYMEYNDFDLLRCSKEEVFVDCGAFDGDSAGNFIEAFKKYKRIYCYEAEPSNCKKLVENLAPYENIVINHKAVGEEFCTMTISDDETGSSIYKGEGSKVEVVPLDEDIKEPVTLVKMDIEGAEQSAIKGMKNHIKEDRPKLIVCVYHGNRDIVEIPKLIDSIRDDYKFYLRNHGVSILNIPVDTSLYAI